jgi:hypothetical protein
MKKFFEAFVYFMENGLGEKLSKELAEKLTGIKAPEGKIEIPKTKSPDQFQTPKAKDDVIEASDNVSGNYVQGDTKYNADILAEEIARKRGFIKDDGVQDSSDMSQVEYSKLYSEAYEYLTKLNFLNKPVKRVETPKKLATRKMRGDLPFINTKLSNPQKNKMVLQGLDGTTESLYSQLRIELEAYKNGLTNNLKKIKENNVFLSSKDKDNITYNIKLVNDLNNKVNQLADDLIKADKSPEKIYQDYRNTQLDKRFGVTQKDLEKELDKDKGILASMDESMEKIKKLLDEMEDIKSGKTERDRQAIVKRKYQGKGYGPSEGIYRTLTRQFLRDEIEAGRIETPPVIYNAMKEGNHPFIDPIKVFRHHYSDDAFDILEKYIDANYPAFGSPGMRYPGRFEFRKLGLVPVNKKAPGKTYAHYSLPDEIDAEVELIDKLIEDLYAGKSPFTRTKEELLEAIRAQNETRAKYIKIRNEIAPEDTKVKPGDELLETADKIDLSQYTNKMLNDLAEEGNKLQDELAQLDESGSSKLAYPEFQKKSARLEQIAKILEEAQKKPEDFFPDDTAEIIPFNLKKSDDDPTKFARGGIVEVLI